LTTLTLGTAKEGQRIDDLSLETDRRYMHHYNFPPYSVGETGFMRGPKRRDIGHGALAQREIGRAHGLNSSHDQISYAVFCLKKEEHTSELQSRSDLVCRLLLEKKRAHV